MYRSHHLSLSVSAGFALFAGPAVGTVAAVRHIARHIHCCTHLTEVGSRVEAVHIANTGAYSHTSAVVDILLADNTAAADIGDNNLVRRAQKCLLVAGKMVLTQKCSSAMFVARDSGHCLQLVPSRLLAAVFVVEMSFSPVLKLLV
jgi:hypothetical protein